MEEEVRDLKELLDVFYKEKDTTWITIHTPQIKNIENILNELDRLQKEREELSRLNEKLEMEYNILLNAKVAIDIGSTESVDIEFLEEYIPKSVIQDKIDVLEKIQKEFKNNEELRIKIITYKELLNKGE